MGIGEGYLAFLQYLQNFQDLLGGIASSPFGLWLLVVFCAAALMFFITAAARARVDHTLSSGHSGQPLGLFDLSHGDAARKLAERTVVAPERLWTYDDDYLDRFRTAAGSALSIYTNVVLRCDMLFALSLASFIVLFWLAAAWVSPALSRLAVFCQCMGILYGFADVAEDLKLIWILNDPEPIDPANAAAANAITRIKFVSVVLSIVGVLVFAVVSAVDMDVRWLARSFWKILLALGHLIRSRLVPIGPAASD